MGSSKTLLRDVFGFKEFRPGQGEIIGYRQQDICETRTIMTEQTVEEITGYRNTIEIDNKIIMLESAHRLTPSERVEITRQVTYSLR